MEKSLRRAQTISPFGVGSVIDIMGESLVAVDITYWENNGEIIREPRLEQKLGVVHFKMAPAKPDYFGNTKPTTVPYFRFPQWFFCRRCRRMYKITVYDETGNSPVCKSCRGKPPLTPMRFVMACPRGHLADVPWDAWAHQQHSGICENPVLRFTTRPGGSGLQYLQIRCDTCGASHTLAGLARRDSLKSLGIRCTGRQPWERNTDRNTCDAIPQIIQRGATNLTFSGIESSISIPPYSKYTRYSDMRSKVMNSVSFGAIRSAIKSNPAHPIVPMLIDLIVGETNLERAVVSDLIKEITRNETTAVVQSSENDSVDLLGPEYIALSAPDSNHNLRDSFIKTHVVDHSYLKKLGTTPYASSVKLLKEKIQNVVKVTRLREVRALRGFSRLGPTVAQDPEDEPAGVFPIYNSTKKIQPQFVQADLGKLPRDNRWLPAIETYGEGIFLTLNEKDVEQWEREPYVVERMEKLERRWENEGRFLDFPTPRLLLLHTLSHILIRQLSFECGYSLASLRERIYARTSEEGPSMAGILIYTAAGDSEGTMGGLARQADLEHLLSAIIRCLFAADWCSSDPVCRESEGQGPGAMNLAACHACALLPETSCTHYNRLLDRGVLVGDMRDAQGGFFQDIILQLRQDMDRQGGW